MKILPFSLHTIFGKHELAIAFGRTEEDEEDAAAPAAKEPIFGFCVESDTDLFVEEDDPAGCCEHDCEPGED